MLKLDHLRLPVTDLGRSRAWYVEALGMTVEFEVPDRPFSLEVDVPTRGVRETFRVDPQTQSNVAISLLDGRLEAAFPERLGFA